MTARLHQILAEVLPDPFEHTPLGETPEWCDAWDEGEQDIEVNDEEEE